MKTEFYFPLHDLQQSKPWIVVYAKKDGRGWSVDFCGEWLSIFPDQYESLEDAVKSWKQCITNANCIMTTKGCPSQKELKAFAKHVYETYFINKNKEENSNVKTK